MKLNAIQMLRAFAAIMVVYTHSISQTSLFASGWQEHVPIRSSLGTFGVDLFFVISGFIICLTAGRSTGRSAALIFLWHRFRRINPVCYAAIVLTLTAWIPSFLRHQRPLPTAQQLLTCTVLLPFSGEPNVVISQAWTLSFEWYFYLLFCLLILTRTKRKIWPLTFFLGGLVLVGWILPGDRASAGFFGFYCSPLLLEFLLGAAVAAAFRRWNLRKEFSYGLLWVGIVLALGLLVTGQYDWLAIGAPETPAYTYYHAFYWGGTAALIVAGCVFLEKTGSSVFSRLPSPVLLLGDASYSIYIFHMLIFGLIAAFYLHVPVRLNTGWATPLHAALAVAASLLCYRLIEVPILRWLGKSAPARPSPPPPAPPSS
jgi:peptidoglycan/LPS O-acetylase OafA/YrhL